MRIVGIVLTFCSSSLMTVMKGWHLGWINFTTLACSLLHEACLVKPHFEQTSTAAPSDFLGSRRTPHVGQNSINRNPS
jgi:hypothetical protein